MGIEAWINIALVAILVGITAYYSWQTRSQAISMKKQLDIVVTQRRKSIAPVLQPSDIKLVDSIIYINRTTRIITPNLSIRLKNIGDGLCNRYKCFRKNNSSSEISRRRLFRKTC